LNTDRNRATHPEWQVRRWYRTGHIYDALINSALDESLARQIFAAVGGRRKGKGKIETMMVRTYGGESFEQDRPGGG
jgi:hypothetical protein